MEYLIQNATIFSPETTYHLQKKDVLISNGFIKDVGDNIQASSDVHTITGENLYAGIGWVDTFAHVGEPGFEERETIITALNSAAAGGFTSIMASPNNKPATTQSTQVTYLKNQAAHHVVDLLPIGAITTDLKDGSLTEMYDLNKHGVTVFSNGTEPIQSADVMYKALLYVKKINGTIMQLPVLADLAKGGLMNEGVQSVQLGLPGIPILAEELMVARDIELCDYANSKLFFLGISSAKSIAMIKAAQKKGIQVSASISPLHLKYSDDDLTNYDTNLKLHNALRNADNTRLLQIAFANGEIDLLTSMHIPQHSDHKNIEFQEAFSGSISLQTAVNVSLQATHISLESLWGKLAVRSRQIFSLPIPEIKPREKANITVFDAAEKWTYCKENNQSKSANSPLFGTTFTGKVKAVFNNQQVQLIS